MLELDLPPGSRLLLVRHGESIWNCEGRIQGCTDVPLSEMGREQARRVAARLPNCGAAALYSSDLQRAVQTAEPIAAALSLPIATEPGLREVAFGRWEGLTLVEARARYPEEWAAYEADPIRNRPEGGERLEALQARAVRAMERLLARHTGQTVLIVAHGGSIRAVLGACLGVPVAAYCRLDLDNASISCVERDRRTPRLRYLNDTAHLRDGS
ncbi:MAG: histidine phosphatase family protein [Armatimonadetes bacterium]|nr:histidine phosphatase family protein [Armatimonadota bacterium]